MVDTQDPWRKKLHSGFVRENPLSSAQARATNSLSSGRPHASATSTQTKPRASVPERSPAVSLRRGDTLWEVAQKKLGDGTRWRELRKADGSQFTGQEARRLTVGTQVHLPGVKPAPSPASTVSVRRGDTLGEIAQRKLGDGNRWRELRKADGSQFTGQEVRRLTVGTQVHLPTKITAETPSAVTLRSSTPRISTQVLSPESIRHHELTLSSTPSTKSSHFSASPALLSKTSQVSSNLISAKDTAHRQYLNGSSYQAQSTGSRDSSDTWNNALINGTVKGIAVGTPIPNRLTRTSKLNSSPISSQNVGTPTANRLTRTMPQTNSLDANRAIGRITERAWDEHFNSKYRSDIVRNIRQTTWKERSTRKTLQFSDAKSRRPDNFIKLNNGRGIAVEIKGTPLAAESSEASKQRARDRIALGKRALLGNRKTGFHEVHRATTKVGLPILGSGGNTALPGETQKHVIIRPRGGAQPLPSTWNERFKLLGGYKNSTTHAVGTRGANASPQTRKLVAPKASSESRTASKIPQAARAVGESRVASVALRGASRIAAPVAVGLDVWRLGDAYKKDGFGKEFRKTAGSVAGGWGGAAAGAAGGAAVGSVVPVVGTAAGAIVGGVIGGIAGSEFGDDIEQGAEKVGKGIVDGGKKVWNKLFG